MDMAALGSPCLVVIVDSPARRSALTSGSGMPKHCALNAPYIVMSDDDSVESFGSAIAGGAAAYLAQPVGVKELLMAARRLIAPLPSSPGVERRRRARRSLLIAIEVDARATGRHMEGWMLDVSGSGCRLEVPEPIPTGMCVRIVLHAGAHATEIALSAEVRWSRRIDSCRYYLGIRFTGTSALLAAKMLGAVPSGQT
jgi:hypothetical protein